MIMNFLELFIVELEKALFLSLNLSQSSFINFSLEMIDLLN